MARALVKAGAKAYKKARKAAKGKREFVGKAWARTAGTKIRRGAQKTWGLTTEEKRGARRGYKRLRRTSPKVRLPDGRIVTAGDKASAKLLTKAAAGGVIAGRRGLTVVGSVAVGTVAARKRKKRRR